MSAGGRRRRAATCLHLLWLALVAGYVTESAVAETRQLSRVDAARSGTAPGAAAAAVLDRLAVAFALDAHPQVEAAPGPAEQRALQPGAGLGTRPTAALYRLNRYRTAAGLAPLRHDPVLSEMAQSHAQYMLINCQRGRPAGGHFQRTHYEGYTVTGDEAARTSGIAHASPDPLRALESLLAGPFHRVQFLDPAHQRVGVGFTHDPADRCGGALFVTRGAGNPTARFVVFPPAGFTDTLTSFHGENPDPRPGGDPGSATGYPITVHMGHDDAHNVRAVRANVTDAKGESVPARVTHPAAPSVTRPPDIYAGDVAASTIDEGYARNFNAVFILPKAELRPATRYTVQVEIDLGKDTERLEWSFRTRPLRRWLVTARPRTVAESLPFALQAAAAGETVQLAAGVHRLDGVRLDRPLRLIGDDGAVLELSNNLTIAAPVVLSNLRIRAQASVAYLTSAAVVLLDRCEWDGGDGRVVAIGMEPGAAAIIDSCDTTRFRGDYLVYFLTPEAGQPEATLYVGRRRGEGSYAGYGPGTAHPLPAAVPRVLTR